MVPWGNREIKITKPDKKFKNCVFVMTLTYKMYKNGRLQFGFDVKNWNNCFLIWQFLQLNNFFSWFQLCLKTIDILTLFPFSYVTFHNLLMFFSLSQSLSLSLSLTHIHKHIDVRQSLGLPLLKMCPPCHKPFCVSSLWLSTIFISFYLVFK